MEADILGNFKALGVSARPLSGLERLNFFTALSMRAINRNSAFNWDLVYKTGLSTKDFIDRLHLISEKTEHLSAVVIWDRFPLFR